MQFTPEQTGKGRRGEGKDRVRAGSSSTRRRRATMKTTSESGESSADIFEQKHTHRITTFRRTMNWLSMRRASYFSSYRKRADVSASISPFSSEPASRLHYALQLFTTVIAASVSRLYDMIISRPCCRQFRLCIRRKSREALVFVAFINLGLGTP